MPMETETNFTEFRNKTIVYEGEKVNSFEVMVIPSSSTGVEAFNFTWCFVNWTDSTNLLL